MSKKQSLPQYVVATVPMGCDYPVVHCPLCGHAGLVPPEKKGGKATPPCDHLAFLYSGVGDRFVHESEDFKKRCAKAGVVFGGSAANIGPIIKVSKRAFMETVAAEATAYVDEDLEEILPKIGYGENLLVVEISYKVHGCSGVCVGKTDIYGFDCGALLNKKILADRSDSLLQDALFLGKGNIEPSRQKSEKAKAPAKPSKITKRPVPKKKTKAASKK